MVTRNKEAHYIMIKGSILQDITIINIYAPKQVKHILRELKEEINIIW